MLAFFKEINIFNNILVNQYWPYIIRSSIAFNGSTPDGKSVLVVELNWIITRSITTGARFKLKMND